MTRLRLLVAGLAAALATASLVAVAPPAGASAPAPLHVAVGGTGGSCTAAAPCGTFQAAYALAQPGQAVVVRGGTYPAQTLKPASRHVAGAPVVFSPAPGAAVTVSTLVEVLAPDVVLRDLTVVGRVRLREAAAGSRLEQSTVTGGSVLVDAPRSAVIASVVQPGVGQDGINVRYGSQVLLQGNRIGPGTRGSTGAHVDCIQVMGGSDIRILDNELVRCPTQQLHVKPDLQPISRVLVEGNRITGCGQRTTACDGYVSIDVRTAGHPVRDVVVRGNVIAGTAYMEDVPGLRVQHNRISWFSRCGSWATDNTVLAVGSACRQPVGTSPTAPADGWAPPAARTAGAGTSRVPSASLTPTRPVLRAR